MKLYKFFAVALAALSLTACSDDDNNWNSVQGVTVSIAQSEMSVAEDAEAGRYYYVPLVLSGETNGPVSVTVEFSGTSEYPATEDKDYVVTQKTITIPAGATSGNIEFYPTGDNEENPDRKFEVKIVSAEGASVAGNNLCVVTLMDNERLLPEAYANIQGVWNFEATTSRGKEEFPMTIVGASEGEDGYLTKLTVSGWVGYSWAVAEANFSFDASTGETIISFPLGQWVATEVNFGDELGICDVMLASVSGNSLVSSGTISATCNPEFTKITFPETAELIGAIFDPSFTGYTWFWYKVMSMSR